jgi:Spy/CpxP family protein refolding chaperone
MRKLTALGTLLTLTLIAPAAYAQTTLPAGTPVHRHPVQRTLMSFQQRIRQGVRGGSLTTEETRALRTRMSALRQEAARLRQSGTPPTLEQRQHLRQQLRQTNRAIYRAKHGR